MEQGTTPQPAPAAAPVQAMAQPKSSSNKVLLYVLGGCGVLLLCSVIAVVAFFALGAGAVKKAADTYDSKKDEVSKENDKAAVKGEGEDQTVDGLKIKISEVKLHVIDDKYYGAKDGYQYVSMLVEVKNESSDSKYPTDLNLSLTSEDDVVFSKSYYKVKEPQFNGKSIAKGETIKGYVTFEVAKSAKKLKAQYKEYTLYGDVVRKWEFTNPTK